ncbi:hypothetical protein PbJCM13498_32660 [Prolixibacter bellariivorans]|jgi:hypothetical protein|uniref:Beta-lactamase-inhibitor-like PepSY-like domain-containing protein n=1 Tax=Prolixibacter bellariivorans TaxID=314319 RepID=A0A5M4B3M9_9BACT|nr:hypothetical protein [Prolixibacter bellariivorans]GET34403.1 hypothetical protein PbJCM13498_32660 [Prolixibacter bellariivorans]
MKKVLIPLVLVFALGTGYVANAANSGSKTMNSSYVMQSELKFISVDVADLPEAVTKAVSNDYKDAKISQASVATTEDGSKVYKIVLQLNGQSMTATYNEDGSKYEPES